MLCRTGAVCNNIACKTGVLECSDKAIPEEVPKVAAAIWAEAEGAKADKNRFLWFFYLITYIALLSAIKLNSYCLITIFQPCESVTQRIYFCRKHR